MDAIERAIESGLEQLPDPFRSGGLAYFGFTDTEDRPLGKVKREERAADRFGRSARWFRTPNRQRPYAGEAPGDWIVRRVAAALVSGTRVEPPTPPLVEDEPLQDIQKYYRSTSAYDLQNRGFFQRSSTTSYISDIARLAAERRFQTTIYAGAGVSSDLGGEPSQFMERLLSQWIQRSELLHEAETDGDREAIADRVSRTLAQTYTTPYLGSIVRELAREQLDPDRDTEEELRAQEEDLRRNVRTLLEAGYIPGRFLARAIAACATAMRHAGADVEILTSNYDSVLTRAAEHIRASLYLPGRLPKYDFTPRTPQLAHSAADSDSVAASGTDDRSISVTHIYGRVDSADTPLVIGECDLFAEYGADLMSREMLSAWRNKHLSSKLRESICIFVGSTLTDPDVLEHLAQTKHRRPRYALLLRPNTTVDLERGIPTSKQSRDSTPVGPLDHFLLRELVARRFLHLGVVPIITEHPHQIPQFLQEVALRVLQGDSYQTYGSRANLWWGYWCEPFGYKRPGGDPGPRSEDLQIHWHKKPLATAMRRLVAAFRAIPGPTIKNERTILEVWVRNPHKRDLVLLARSDSQWLDAATAHHASLRGQDSGYIAQKTFQRGDAWSGELPDVRGQWRYGWSIPLVLHKEPWYHLPVGVVNVLSNKSDHERDARGKIVRNARLLSVADPKRSTGADMKRLEDSLKKCLLDELDPRSSTWRSPQRMSWSGYQDRHRKRHQPKASDKK
jgi:SIR2-like domain